MLHIMPHIAFMNARTLLQDFDGIGGTTPKFVGSKAAPQGQLV